MSTAPALNPYQPPSDPRLDEPRNGEPTQCERWAFHGSMRLEEGAQIAQLMAGKTQSKNDFTKSNLLWLVCGSVILFGWVGFESFFDDVTELLEFGVGIVGVAAVIATVYLQKQRQEKLHAELKRQQQGVFTPFSGHVSENGIEYRIGDLPVHYAWEDLVGGRFHDDALLLYVDYPKEMNFLAASLFPDASCWESAKRVIQQHVPRLGRFPKLNKRAKSQRMQQISAGTSALQKEQWQAALHHFDQALLIEPNDIQALQGRIIAAVATHDFDLAWDVIETVTARGLTDATTRRLRATVLLSKDRFAEAIEEYDPLTEEFPDDPDLLRDRGLALLKLGRCEEALRDASRSLELRPRDPVTLNNRGATFLELKQFDAAIADLQAAIDLAPQFERPRELLPQAKELSG